MQESQNITFFKILEEEKNLVYKRKRKIAILLIFPMLGILSLTIALQSSPFKNTGGVVKYKRDEEEVRTKEILMSNIG